MAFLNTFEKVKVQSNGKKIFLVCDGIVDEKLDSYFNENFSVKIQKNELNQINLLVNENIFNISNKDGSLNETQLSIAKFNLKYVQLKPYLLEKYGGYYVFISENDTKIFITEDGALRFSEKMNGKPYFIQLILNDLYYK